MLFCNSTIQIVKVAVVHRNIVELAGIQRFLAGNANIAVHLRGVAGGAAQIQAALLVDAVTKHMHGLAHLFGLLLGHDASLDLHHQLRALVLGLLIDLAVHLGSNGVFFGRVGKAAQTVELNFLDEIAQILELLLGLTGEACDQGGAQGDAGDLAAQLADHLLARLFHGEDHLESYGAKKDFPLGGKRVIGTPAHYAYLKIAEGCNNRCHYCAIPGIRGPLHSRDMADCVAEARWLAGEGVKELIVVAQDPTAYGEDWGKPGSICELLDKLNKVPGLEWIRIMYAYPERITDEFIAAMKRNEKVVPYLDLPIQHCNDTILKNMNRRSNRAELLEVIGKLRREIPGITLRTTLIAGFPGETEEQFEDLCNFVKEVQFDRLGCFAYSAEENTVAAKMDGQIEQEVKDKRAELVMQIQTGIMAQKQAEKVGQTVHVLCDGIDEESGLYLCRTTGDAPEVDGNVCVSSEEPLYPGQFYDVLVDDSDLYDLYGTVAK